MTAWIYDIEARVDMRGWANLDDFVLGAGQSVEPDIVLTRQNWSLYSLDEKRQLAVFVDLPDGTDLAQSAFAYTTQHQLAQRVLTMPLSELERVADALPPVERIVLVFSIGRCGSTLMSHALNTVPGVWCLSEPDALSTLVMQHFHSTERTRFAPDRIIRLIRACIRLQFRPPMGEAKQVFAIKFRSQALFLADLYHRALPDAAYLFLYRDALGWANSVYGMMRQYGIADSLTGEDRDLPWRIGTGAADQTRLRQLVDLDAAEIPAELTLAPSWAHSMAEYTRHLRAGVPFMALRYNEFNKDREASVARMLRHCRLPVEAVAMAASAFEADSQAGTLLARDVTTDRLSAERLARLRDILAREEAFSDPDLRLPDIYTEGRL
jgi:hypothetical protein